MIKNDRQVSQRNGSGDLERPPGAWAHPKLRLSTADPASSEADLGIGLPIYPVPIDPLPIDPLPIDPLPIDPVPIDPGAQHQRAPRPAARAFGRE